MRSLSYTLIGDGPSDRVLMHVIDWALGEEQILIQDRSWGDLSLVKERPRDLTERARWAIELFPCDVLFVHRDAEGGEFAERHHEVLKAVRGLEGRFVPVVPVRMTEAWLLHDENAIRFASGNPRGTVNLGLPPIKRLESLPDPKQILFEALIHASELTGRRRRQKQEDRSRMRARVGELIQSFAPLEELQAFARFRADLRVAIRGIR